MATGLKEELPIVTFVCQAGNAVTRLADITKFALLVSIAMDQVPVKNVQLVTSAQHLTVVTLHQTVSCSAIQVAKAFCGLMLAKLTVT